MPVRRPNPRFAPSGSTVSRAEQLESRMLLSAAPVLYWSESTRTATSVITASIMRSHVDGTGAQTVLTQDNSENVFGGIAVDVEHGSLYSGTRRSLFRANLDGTGRTNLVPTLSANQVADVELDVAGGKVYWSEGAFSVNSIRRANLDGTDPQTLLNVGLTAGVEGIALDLAHGKLYFTGNFNSRPDEIGVMNLDGTDLQVFKTLEDGSNPHDVEFDAAAARVYWDEVGSISESVRGASVDGSGDVQVVVVPPDGMENGFHFDPVAGRFYVVTGDPAASKIAGQKLGAPGIDDVVTGRTFINYPEVARADQTPPDVPLLYWSESARNRTSIITTRIMRSHVDGTTVQTVLTLDNSENGFGGIAFDMSRGHLYSGTRKSLFRADLDGANRVDLVNTRSNNQVADVELDLPGGKVYWSEGAFGSTTVRRADLDGNNPQTLFDGGITSIIEGIALDPALNKLFFTRDYNTRPDEIWVMNLDGTDPQLFKTLEDGSNPHDVEFDPIRGVIYWNEIGEGSESVREAPADGSGDVDIDFGVPDGIENGFHYDPVARRFYLVPGSPGNVSRIIGHKTGAADFDDVVIGRTFINYPEVARPSNPAHVSRVYVSGSTWTPAFKQHLQAIGAGDAVYGFALHAEARPLDPLPWTNLNRISMTFDRDVAVERANLSVSGTRVPAHDVSDFEYDNTTRTATWTLSHDFENDRLRVDFRNGIAVADDFQFTLNVLPGDVNRSGAVLADDFSAVKKKFFSSTTTPGAGAGAYDIFHDLDGGGTIVADDFSEVRKCFFNRLPDAPPGATPSAVLSGVLLPATQRTLIRPPRRGRLDAARPRLHA
jgi:hypothetical protein